MPAHKIYHTPEEKAEAKRRNRAKYQASERGRAKRVEWEAAHPELVETRYARYRETDKYRESQRRYRTGDRKKATDTRYREWAKETDPARVQARAAVTVAIRKGTLKRPDSCQACGRPGIPDGHHHLGYAAEHWLAVLWLCRGCHKRAHS